MVVLIDMLLPAAMSTGVAYGYNWFLETNPAYRDAKTMLKYSAVVGASTLLGNMTTGLLIPNFHNPKLATLQKTLMSAGSTAGLNILGQRFANDDIRIDFNLACGAVSGAGSSLGTSMVHKYFLE